jgi:hypothetical protein
MLHTQGIHATHKLKPTALDGMALVLLPPHKITRSLRWYFWRQGVKYLKVTNGKLFIPIFMKISKVVYITLWLRAGKKGVLPPIVKNVEVLKHQISKLIPIVEGWRDT